MQYTLPDPSFLAACGEPLLDPSDTDRLPRRRAYDIVVVGAGVAGLAFALRLPPMLRIALLTKGALGESNTRWAQGGLSAAIGADDSPALHEADTLAAGAGLCDPAAVRELVDGAPAAVDWLLALGTRFDRDEATGDVLLGREAAHSRRRVLHAGGDATGAEIERALVAGVRGRPGVDIFAGAFALDLLVDDGRCTGLIAELSPGDGPTRIDAQAVVVAAGGAGQLWATTSNPSGATADGIAMALRAGVAVADLEFAQFHPTVLALPDGAPFLVSEAVRGEGAFLRGQKGTRFMIDLHAQAELAPRDVVARGIQRQMALDGADHVDLDLRHLDGPAMRRRFPTIARELAARGIDLATDRIPIAPAAHYFMGGIAAATDGRTSLPGLLALGEAACTGVHGANRLASNSLLEGLVFGLRAADRIAEEVESRPETPSKPVSRTGPEESPGVGARLLRERVQRAMSRHVAVVREASGLREAAAVIDGAMDEFDSLRGYGRRVWETRNLLLAARGVVSAALLREESRGAHFRSDFPAPDRALDGCHLLFGGASGTVWRYGTLDEARSPEETVTG